MESNPHTKSLLESNCNELIEFIDQHLVGEKKSQTDSGKNEEDIENLLEGLRREIEKIKNKDKKVNFIFFGAMSSGKTTSINLLLKLLSNLNYNVNMNFSNQNNQPCPNPQNLMQETFELVSTDAENTYFLTIIERSENDRYTIYLELNEAEKKIFEKSKQSLFTIKKSEINSDNYQIYEEFPNTQEGIKKLNNILEEIDVLSEDLLLQARESEFNQEQNNPNEENDSKEENDPKEENNPKEEENINLTIPIIKIKIPNFSSEFRLVDTPGLSLKRFSTEMARSIKKEFDFLNVFIFVNKMDCETMYNIDCEVFKRVTTFGQPIIYSFYTKGLSLMEKLRKNRNAKNREKDRKKFFSVNKRFFNRLKSIEGKEILFRKIIPIVDSEYDNDDVRENLEIFIDDVRKVIREYGEKIYQNTARLKIRGEIMKINDELSKKNILNPKELSILYDLKYKYESERKNKIREYFAILDSFENYKKYFPDQIHKLEEIYEKNEHLNPNNFSRRNYINKHLEYSFNDFQLIIIEPVEEINKFYMAKIFDSLNKDLKDKIMKRLEEEGLVDIQTTYYEGILSLIAKSNGISIDSLSKNTLYTYLFSNISDTVKAGFDLIHYLVWLPGIINFAFFSTGLHQFLIKIGAKEEVTKGLFQWFLKNKGEIAIKCIEIVDKMIEKYVEFFKNKMETIPLSYNMLNIVEKIQKEFIDLNEFKFDENQLLSMIKDEELKKFTKEALEHQLPNLNA